MAGKDKFWSPMEIFFIKSLFGHFCVQTPLKYLNGKFFKIFNWKIQVLCRLDDELRDMDAKPASPLDILRYARPERPMFVFGTVGHFGI